MPACPCRDAGKCPCICPQLAHHNSICDLEERVRALEGDMHMREAWSDNLKERVEALEQRPYCPPPQPRGSCGEWLDRAGGPEPAAPAQAATPAQQPREGVR